MSEAKTLKKLNLTLRGEREVSSMVNWTVSDLEVYASDNRNEFDRIIIKDVFNKVSHPLELMQDIYLVAVPGARVVIDVPYGSHDRAYELDCKRAIFADTLRVLEPEWKFHFRIFYLDGMFFDPDSSPEQLGMAVAQLRNVVKGFACELIAQKPVPPNYSPTDPVTQFKFV